MDNLQYYDPNAPASRFSSALRFRPLDPESKPAAKANKKVSAGTRPRQPASVSEIAEGEEPPNQTTAVEEAVSLSLQPSKVDRPQVNDDDAETPALIIDGHSDPHDGNNYLDDGDNKSDGHDSLRSLFSPAELDGDSSETDLGVEAEQEGLHKRLSENAVPAPERSRTGDSADMPIDLERDSSAVELNDFAGPHSAESEHERHLGFDERIPLSLSLPDASGPVENDDGSDSDTTNHFTFRKRKLRSEVSDVRSNVPLSSHPQEGDRVTGGRESERGEKDGGRRKHRRHSDRDRAGKRDDRSLSGVHIEEDGDDAARIRRRMGSTLRRRHARDTSNLTSQWAKRWHRSASSSAPDESQRNSGVVVSLKKTAQSLPQSAPRRQRGPNLFSTTPSEDLTSDEEEGCGHGDLDLADRPSRSDLTTPRTAPKVRETKETARSNLDDPHLTADERQDEFVWLHGPLLGYKVVNGKPHVLVPWYPTWEPSDEYQSEEVERVKQQAVSRTLGKRRGRPPLRVVGGESNESAHAR